MAGGEFAEGPDPSWMDIEDAYARTYRLGFYPENFLDFIGETGKEIEVLPIYLRQRPFNLILGRPHYPEQSAGVCFLIQVIAAPERPDIKRELYAALEGEQRLFMLHKDELRRISRRKTDEILKMVREGQIIPKEEFTQETAE